MKTNFEQEANFIGSDSYELQEFTQLPSNATRQQIVDALNDDRQWQQSHHEEVQLRLDRLINLVRGDDW